MGRIISGRYEELEQLGQGSQGVVYKVRHVEHKTDLALKVLPSYLLEDEEMVARFEQEAQMMTRLRHRNIARVLGSGRDEALKLHFIVTEYIQGKNLKQHLREKGPLTLSEVLEITRQIAGALDYAHNQPLPIVHRDIKPTNLMLEDFSGRVVVLDFGIAKELGESERSHTRTGVMLGTWKYCAPEQLRHEPISGSADVYSLGMVMYEMYTGTPFFSGLDEHAVLGKVLYDQREHIPYFARQTPPAFVTLVTKAIAKSRDKRYRRMADLLNDLEACWWALDDTRTMILSPQSLNARSPDVPIGDIAELDDQIRLLEEERLRHTVTAIQGQVRITKEQAERNGARQWASALFEQGLARETEGEAYSRERQYTQAQGSYEAAISLFTQASEEASKSATAQQLEKEQQATYIAKADAERAGADEQTNETYTQALTTLMQADQLWEQQHWLKAEPLYQDARHLFEDARDFSYRAMQRREAEAAREQAQRATLRKEAEVAQTSMQVAQKAALLVNADMLAGGLIQEAKAAEQQAATALTNEEFVVARQYYETAQQQYARAEAQARTEQQRQMQRARVAARETQATHDHVSALTSDLESFPAYQGAKTTHQHATALFAANQYAQAEAAYRQARQQYEHAGRVAEQRQITSAQERMRTAQEAAVHAGAPQFCAEEWIAAMQSTTAVQPHVDRGETAQAVEAFQQAMERFTQLRSIAEQRKVEAEEQHQRVLTAQRTAEEGRTAAENVEAPQYVAALYRQATQLMDDAQQHLQAARWQEALPLLTQAQELFAKASEDAAHEKARQAADAMRRKAVAIQHEAQSGQGPVYFPERFTQAATLLRHAEAALQRGDFSLAKQGFEQGAFLFQKIRHTAAVREQAEKELAALSVSILPTPEQEVLPQPPTGFSQPTQAEQREGFRALSSDRPANGQVQEKPLPGVALTTPPSRQVEPLRSTSPPSTIPPTALPSGKVIAIGTVLFMLVIIGYILRSRSADEPKNVATAPAVPFAPGSSASPRELEARKTDKPPQLPPLVPETTEKSGTKIVPPSSTSSEKGTRSTTEDEEQRRATITPPLSAPLPLTIQRAEPGPGEEFTLREGETLPFSVTVDDGDSRSLQYRWTLNGVQQSTDAAWRYKPKFDDAEETPKAVHVVVRDDAGHIVEREWRVRVLNVNRSPTIMASTPRLGTTVQMAAGATQTFSVNATDPDKEGPLTYRWLLDGEEVGAVQTGTWQFRAPPNDGTHQLTVEIHDAVGEKTQRSWDVVVKAVAPSLRWVRVQPKDEWVRTQMEQPVEFTALAELSTSMRGVESIQYQWRVNDSVLETEERGRFRFSENRAGLYQVSVVALTAEGIRSPVRKWSIDVRAFESSPAVKSPEEITPDPRWVERCTNDVRGVLESVRRAWETKNVRTLTALGIITRWDMETVAEKLKQYQAFRVALVDVEIQCGGDQATASFTRVDTIDGTTFAHPERTILHLEKRNSRWVIRSR
jgi:serine/threonine protein kinase